MDKEEKTYFYYISLATQLGKKSGRLFLSVFENRVEGIMEILGRRQSFLGKLNDDGSCTLFGQLKTLLSVFDYTASGYFDENGIELDLRYKHGSIRVAGQPQRERN